MASISLVRVAVLLFLFASLFEFVSGQFKPRRRKFRQVPTLSRSRSASNPSPERNDRPGPDRNRNDRRPPGRRLRRTVRPASPKDVNGTEIEPYDTVYWFDQLIDHNNPSKGTFKQRYWHTWEFYEPGEQIILYICYLPAALMILTDRGAYNPVNSWRDKCRRYCRSFGSKVNCLQ